MILSFLNVGFIACASRCISSSENVFHMITYLEIHVIHFDGKPFLVCIFTDVFVNVISFRVIRDKG